MEQKKSRATKDKTDRAKPPGGSHTDPVAQRIERRLTLEEVLQSLLHDRLISQADANIVKAEASMQRTVELHPLVVVANQKLENQRRKGKPLSLEVLTRWLARKARLPYQKVDSLKVDVPRVTQIISGAYATQYKILPLEIDRNTVTFATSEPYLTQWIDDISRITRRQIRRVVANPLDVHRYLLEFYSVTRSMQQASEERGEDTLSGILNFEQLLKLGQVGNLTAEDQHIVHIVDWLLQFAFEQRASDIHLEPRRDMGRVRFRIDGKLAEVYQIPSNVMAAVTSRIKILGRMDVAEKRRPQDGRIKTLTQAGQEIELRLSTMPTAFGEKFVMRIFDPDVVVKDFAELGFSGDEISVWDHMVNRPFGIVLVTGPTGSGKTTTLYSTLKVLAKPELNVCTVEDPIEMISPEFNQMQVQPKVDLGFAQGVRTLLRQDPDIIMIGEIRDLPTAEIAIQAALTGHLVLSTLHTNDAPSAITRLLDLGLPHYLIQGTLTGIVAQRLVRTLCPHCKTLTTVDEVEWQTLVYPWKVEMPRQAGMPRGCLECRKTGFLGRRAIFEMISLSPALKEIMEPGVSVQRLREQALAEGMRPLRLSAAALVASGRTTIREVLEVVPPTELS